MSDSSSAKGRASLRFENIPLVEVVLRRVVETPVPISLALAQKVANAFPGTDLKEDFLIEAVPGKDPTSGPETVEGIPAFRLTDPESGIIYRIQSDQLSVYWTNQLGVNYAGIESIWNAADSLYGAFQEAHADFLPLALTNLTYSNKIDSTLTDRGGRAPAVWPFSPGFFPEEFKGLGDFTNFQCQTSNRIKVDLNLHVRLVKSIGTDEEWFLMSTSAGMWLKGLAVEDAQRDVHDSLTEFFKAMLSDDAKEAYGYRS